MRVALAATAIVALLAWQYSVVMRRREAMEADRHTFLIAMSLPGVPEPEGMARIGRLRELLGDRPVQSIYVDPGPHRQTEIDRLRELFPEAEIDPRPPEYTY